MDALDLEYEVRQIKENLEGKIHRLEKDILLLSERIYELKDDLATQHDNIQILKENQP